MKFYAFVFLFTGELTNKLEEIEWLYHRMENDLEKIELGIKHVTNECRNLDP